MVQPRDNLWDIAEAHLRDGMRWREIWRLNEGRTQPDGDTLRDPDLIQPGWQLRMPADARSLPAWNGGGDAAPARQGQDTGTARKALGGTTAGGSVEEDAGGSVEEGPAAGGPTQEEAAGGTAREGVDEPAPSVPDNNEREDPSASDYHQPDPHAGQGAPAREGVAGAVVPPPASVATAPAGETPSVPRQAEPRQGEQPRGERVADEALGDVGADDTTDEDNPADTVAVWAGGGLLAGVSLLALSRHRRRQFRHRRPGRTIEATPKELRRAEKQLIAAGTAAAADVTWLNRALRALARHLAAQPDGTLPDVLAVRLSDANLELLLTTPAAAPPAPWSSDDTGLRWRLRRDADLDWADSWAAFGFAPFPALASIGYTATGEHWLLDLERVGALSLVGDPERCLNLARFLAAELAHNTWSESLAVTLVGFGEEMAELNPDRLTYTKDLDAALKVLEAQVRRNVPVLDRTGVDVLQGRLRDIDGDLWVPHVLLVAPGIATDTTALSRLLDAMRARHGRTAVAIVLADGPGAVDGTRCQLRLDESGALHVPALGLELIAQGIPVEEAAGIAGLIAQAAQSADAPMPPARGDQPWDAHADAAGALVGSVNASDPSDANDANDDAVELGATERDAAGAPPVRLAAQGKPRSRGESVLPLPGHVYLERTATTAEDIATLAPHVGDEVRRKVEGADPTLDDDLAAWYDPACPAPKVTLLGPVHVRAQGSLPAQRPRPAWHTEIVAYLATHPRGVTAERFASDMWPEDPDASGKTKVRQSISLVRRWLGVNPDTGRDYLPDAAPGPSGIKLYRLEGVRLVDAELFRRLRLRGVARSADGITDLHAALELATGVPLDQRREDGYRWLTDLHLDHEYQAMIVDVAHLVATHHLGLGDPERAAWAAQVALHAGSTDDIALLDMVAACDAMDNRAEADTWVRRILTNHDAEVEEDLPPRTAAVLHRRQWLHRAS
ncbi:MAG: LysM peptidoglycan-binding domain-containing protein [Actinomycetota bacterium]|nr:LysM peptidoglycan-binding domain-containing protein [Actinomycetota bacterium]